MPGGGGGGAAADALRQQCEELRRQLQEARAAEARLQGEVERLAHQEAAQQLQLSRQVGLAQQAGVQAGEALDGGEAAAAAADGAVLAVELAAARQATEAAVAERDRARAQLSRCWTLSARCGFPAGFQGFMNLNKHRFHPCTLAYSVVKIITPLDSENGSEPDISLFARSRRHYDFIIIAAPKFQRAQNFTDR